ncbi:MAG TPA: hypothetical protein VF585_00885 [Chthoniobacterales bacterium]
MFLAVVNKDSSAYQAGSFMGKVTLAVFAVIFLLALFSGKRVGGIVKALLGVLLAAGIFRIGVPILVEKRKEAQKVQEAAKLVVSPKPVTADQPTAAAPKPRAVPPANPDRAKLLQEAKAEYEALNEEREQLDKSDPKAVAAFNKKAAAYKAKADRLKYTP